ncbi:hypothetical protein R5N98_05270 [Tenacibaculum maritimum]|uniref:hypothetical protein n=4 Tax=Tenacibaculum maritimum TaxID=107401 RepID=UPI0038761E92
MHKKKYFKSVKIPWRLESVLEINISEEDEILTITCLGNFGLNKIKTIKLYFNTFFSVSTSRLLNDSKFMDKKKYDWGQIMFRNIFHNNPIEWNELIFNYMKDNNLCPDPFIYTIERSEDIINSDIPLSRQERFNHFLLISDEFYSEIIAEGDFKWKLVDELE